MEQATPEEESSKPTGDEVQRTGSKPGDAIGRLRSLAAESAANEKLLRRAFAQLEEQLREASKGVAVYGQSETTVLDSNGDDQETYGFLFFGERGLGVGFRTIEEDMCDANISKAYGPLFSTETISKCPAAWLPTLAHSSVLDALFSSVVASVVKVNESFSQALNAVQGMSSLPLRGLEEAIETAARQLDYEGVLGEWHSAQRALHVDPADAATRACRLLETLCKRILEDEGASLPRKKSLQTLFKAATNQVSLSRDQQTSDDLRAIASGIATIAHGVGSLRTHRGTAHGQSKKSQVLAEAEARLAVDAAGIVSTFLMRIVHSKRVE